MLELLRIRNFALVESVDIEFSPGLNALTGETGAGKSIILDALGMLAGSRAPSDAVRSGAERAVVEAEINVSAIPDARDWLAAQGLETADASPVLLRREIVAGGRSRGAINGALATAAQLQEFASLVFEIHGQGEQAGLLLPRRQLELLDEFAGVAPLLDGFRETRDRAVAARDRLDALSRSDAEARQRADFLAWQIAEVESVAPVPGEFEELRRERDRLAHVDALRRGAAEALGLLSERPDGDAAIDQVGKAQGALAEMLRHDDSMEPLAAALDEAAARLDDCIRRVAAYSDGIDADPGRLAEIDDRLELLRQLTRKHRAEIGEILERLAGWRTERDSLENRDVERAAAAAELEIARRALGRAVDALSVARRAAAAGFGRAVQDALERLALPRVRFECALAPLESGEEAILPDGKAVACGASGGEHAEFLFSANAGEPLRPLRRVASGGELSRTMLALRIVAAGSRNTPVVVLDEVDAGIGGRAAAAVAEALEEAGRSCQLLCVTHQPAIAARASAQFVVEKEESNGRTTTRLRRLASRERIVELARLLDGRASASSRKLAAEMLREPAAARVVAMAM